MSETARKEKFRLWLALPINSNRIKILSSEWWWPNSLLKVFIGWLRCRVVFPSKEVSSEWTMSPMSELKKKVTWYHIMYTCPETSAAGHASPAAASPGEARSSLSDLLHEKALRTCHRPRCWHLRRDLLASICAAHRWRNNKGDSRNYPNVLSLRGLKLQERMQAKNQRT